MAKIYVFLAEGFEEIEALTPVDILRRCNQEVAIVSTDDADVLLLPGGMPGSANLNEHEGVRQALLAHHAQGKLIGAICAAPMVLGSLGLLQGRRATCSPGFEKYLTGAEYTADLCTVDGNIITGEGPAASFPYAYKLLSILTDEATSQALQVKMQFAHLMA